MRSKSKLLISEPPLQVLPTLACALGLNEAMFIQQLHYRLLYSRHEHDQLSWVYNTVEEWANEFPFWSVPTLRRIITGLREKGLLLVRNDLNTMPQDKTFWYSIDYEAFDAFVAKSLITESDQIDHSKLSKRSLSVIKLITPGSDQFDHTITNRIEEEKEEEEKAPSAAAKPSSFKSREVSEFVKAYEHVWGVLISSPYEGDKVKEWEGRVTLEGWTFALQEAADAKVKTWKYLEVILGRVEKDGNPTKPKEQDPSLQPKPSNTLDFNLEDILR